MKSIQITLEGEEAIFSWKEGKVYCEGYDLESEKAVLALTGFGQGIGVLLVASNDCCHSGLDLAHLLKEFQQEMQGISSERYLVRFMQKRGPLFYQYHSYSPDEEYRYMSVAAIELTDANVRRILQDPSEIIVCLLASRKDLPKDYYDVLSRHHNFEVRNALLNNESLPEDVLERLALDDILSVRGRVIRNPNVPQEILEMLVFDPNWSVAFDALCRVELTKKLQIKIVDNGNLGHKIYLATCSKDSEVLALLVASAESPVLRALERNEHFQSSISKDFTSEEI